MMAVDPLIKLEAALELCVAELHSIPTASSPLDRPPASPTSPPPVLAFAYALPAPPANTLIIRLFLIEILRLRLRLRLRPVCQLAGRKSGLASSEFHLLRVCVGDFAACVLKCLFGARDSQLPLECICCSIYPVRASSTCCIPCQKKTRNKAKGGKGKELFQQDASAINDKLIYAPSNKSFGSNKQN